MTIDYSVFDYYKIPDLHKRIQDMYLADKRPWVIGYSGGKDSTTVVQLVFNALSELNASQLFKAVYVISTDTLVETPLILDYISDTLEKIDAAARNANIPLTVHRLTPEIQDSFWVTLIGKGYPCPRQKFRWCTDRLKIKPANKFIQEKISGFGEVIVVLGVRMNESSSRDQVMNKLKVEGKTLLKHNSMANAYVYAPIEDFTVDDVWTYLLQVPAPCGGDNHELYKVYSDSSAGECTLTLDKDSPSCGNSRFGCWTCTVVQEDKALKGFIESGVEWVRPLLKYRNWLCEIRDNNEFREKRRRDGSIYYIGKGADRRIGLGPFNLMARKEMLRRLLETQLLVGIELISLEEMRLIRRHWVSDGDWQDSLPVIYKEVMEQDYPDAKFEEISLVPSSYEGLLERICSIHDVPIDVVKKLVSLEFEHYGYKVRIGLMKDIGRILQEDWLHAELKEELEDITDALEQVDP